MNIAFKRSVKEDCKLLIDINNKSYHSDYIRYGECPGYNISREKMLSSIENKEIEKHIVYADNVPVGVISIHNEGRGKYYKHSFTIITAHKVKRR